MYSVVKRNNQVSRKVNDLFDGVSCSECGGTHFRFERRVALAGFPFYGYTCLKCGSLIFMDQDAMIDHPLGGKKNNLTFSQNKTKLLSHSK